jgi:hypothetical protein
LRAEPVRVAARQLSKNLEPTYLQKNELNSDVFISQAEKCRMLIWPSHIPHGVGQGTADEREDRIVVAFNIMIRGVIETHAMGDERRGVNPSSRHQCHELRREIAQGRRSDAIAFAFDRKHL